MANIYEKATAPTLYFIGVTTGQTTIINVSPHGQTPLTLKDAVIMAIFFTPLSPA